MVAPSFLVTDPATAGAAPIVWVLHDGKAGMASQALGLAGVALLVFRRRGTGPDRSGTPLLIP